MRIPSPICAANPAEELLKVKGDFPFRPVVDGYLWSRDTAAIFRDGQQNRVPVIVGSNSDEGTVLGVPPESADDFMAMVKRQYKDQADELLKFFPASSNAEALEIVLRVAAGHDGFSGAYVGAWRGALRPDRVSLLLHRITRRSPRECIANRRAILWARFTQRKSSTSFAISMRALGPGRTPNGTFLRSCLRTG